MVTVRVAGTDATCVATVAGTAGVGAVAGWGSVVGAALWVATTVAELSEPGAGAVTALGVSPQAIANSSAPTAMSPTPHPTSVHTMRCVLGRSLFM